MKCLCAFPLLLLVLCGATLAFAQSTNATISGVVVDPAGKVIPDAAIEIVNDATGVHYSSETNGAGIYTITILPPGQYRVQVSRVGFKTLIKPGIILNVQSALALNFTMPIGATSESITVEAGASEINTTDGSVSTVIDRNFVENMPLNGRSFQDLLTLSPGVSQIPVNLFGGTVGGVGYSGEIVVNGQRTEANYFTVDGVSVNTGVQAGSNGQGAGAAGGVAGETALGSTQSLVSIDALQEFRATTSTYSAEYGRTPGGQFSFTTRSGENEIHGTTYDYFRNDAMDANNWFNDYLSQPKGRERQNDFGGTFGGPIIIPNVYNGRRKTFFFGSYEGLRLDSPQPAVQVDVPDGSLRQNAPPALQPALDAFPLQNGGEDGLGDGLAYYIQTVSFPSHLDSTGIRIDHHFSDEWNIFGRYANTPSTNSSYTEAVQNLTSGSVQSLTLGSTNIVNARQNNELRFNFTRNSNSQKSVSTNLGGAVPLELTAVPGLGDGSATLTFYLLYGTYPQLDLGQTSYSQDQYNVTDVYNLTFGHHSIRTGADWRRLESQLELYSPNEAIYFFSQNEVLTDSASLGFAETSPISVAKPIYTNFSAFVQDEWKATAHFSLSMGLRWDVNPAPGDGTGHIPYTLTQTGNLATASLAPAGTSLWKTDWRGLAPRFGLAYQLNRTPGHETAIRAGYGIFYDMGTVLGSFGYSGIGFSTTEIYSGISYPFTSSELKLPAPSITPPYTDTIYAFDPNLKLPYSMQYNLSLEKSLHRGQNLTVSYVGSNARKLLTTFAYYPGLLGNPNFSGTSALVDVTANRASSGYNSFQAKFQGSDFKGLQTFFSYTWSHSIDDASANSLLSYLLRASSDFDIRSQFQAAVTYTLPEIHSTTLVDTLLNHWAADLRVQARSSLPVDITSPTVVVPGTGQQYGFQPSLVQGKPIYLRSDSYPGKRILDYNAFTAVSGVEGDLPRNFARAFDAVQTDIALRRSVPLHEKLTLQVRCEAFNVFNHPQFGAIYNNLAYGPKEFGYAYNTLNGQLGGLNPLYQSGGPRSLQLMLKLSF